MKKDEALEFLSKDWPECVTGGCALCEKHKEAISVIRAALSPPCACGGREPLAVLHGYAVVGGDTERKNVHLAVQEWLIIHDFEDIPACLEGESVRVIILPAGPGRE